jgi:RNA polymerase sigma-70 factor (ECF subfamily)
MDQNVTIAEEPPAAAELRSDRVLMERLGRGDPKPMAELVERYQARLWRLAFRLCTNRAQADDLVQEAFLRLYRSASHYRPEASLATYLHRIVVNLAIDARRTAHPALPLSSLKAPLPQDEVPNPLIESERSLRVQAALRSLPDRQRTAVILHRYESLSYREIAQVMEASESAVESLIMRAYAQLRERLADLCET